MNFQILITQQNSLKKFLIDISAESINDFVRFVAFTAFVLTSFVRYFDSKELLRVSEFDSVCSQSFYFSRKLRDFWSF